MDAAAGVAGDTDAVCGPGGAASAGVGVRRAARGRLVAAPALGSAQGPTECAGRGAVPARAPRGDSATSLGVAGWWRKRWGRAGAEVGYVRVSPAPVRQR